MINHLRTFFAAILSCALATCSPLSAPAGLERKSPDKAVHEPTERKSPDKAHEPTPDTCPVEIRWGLAKETSSLVEIRQDKRVFINTNDSITTQILYRKGRADSNPAMHRRVRLWLLDRCPRVNAGLRIECSTFLADPNANLIDLLSVAYRDILVDMYPSEKERQSPAWTEADESIYREWVINYVGRWIPVLRFTVDNARGAQPVRVVALVYDVEEVNQAKALMPRYEPVRYYWILPFKVGKHRLVLNEERFGEIEAIAGQASTFEVAIVPDEKTSPPHPVWSGTLSVETNRGTCSLGGLDITTFGPGGP